MLSLDIYLKLVLEMMKYCKSGNFREHFIFANSVKDILSTYKKSRLWHDLSIPVIDRAVSQFHEDFIFMKLHINPSKNFRINSISYLFVGTF